MDVLIVGFGIAGVCLANQLEKNNISFHVIDSPKNSSSLVAGGVMNPAILKRYTMSWDGVEFYKYAIKFYEKISKILDYDVYNQISIKRIFSSEGEHNKWNEASGKRDLSFFLNKEIELKISDKINTPYGFGKLKNVGRLNFREIISRYKSSLNEKYTEEMFDYSSIAIYDNQVKYKNNVYKKIIFCEGYSMKFNPFFKYLPLPGNKGEMFIIKAPLLSNKIILKGKFFIVPLKKDFFWVGATFSNYDKSINKTSLAKTELLSELKNKLNIPFEVVSHNVQIRPTVIDRRPLLGSHPEIKNFFVFNGLGTRGSLMAPRLSKFLFDYIFLDKVLPDSIDIKRFIKD